MKKIIGIIFVLAALGAGGFFVFDTYFNAKKVTIWDMVPAHAIFVYQSNNLTQQWNDLQRKPIWRTLLQVPYFEEAKTNFELLDSLLGSNGAIDKLFKNQNTLLSCHVTAQNEFDFLWLLNLENPNSQSVIIQLQDRIKRIPTLKMDKRTLSNFDIIEFTHQVSGKSFSYVIYDNYLIGSFTSLLVEDVIRNISGGFTQSFRIEPLQDLVKIDDDDGNLYANLKLVPSWFKTFLKQDLAIKDSSSVLFGGSAFWDVKIEDQAIKFDGFALNDTKKQGWLSTFSDEKPSPILVKHIVPNRTSTLLHLGIQSGPSWKQKLLPYFKMSEPSVYKAQSSLSEQYQTDMSKFYDWMGSEIALAIVESNDPELPEKLLYIQTNDMPGASNALNTLAEQIIRGKEDTIYTETYADHEIRQLAIKDFPQILLGNYFEGFEQCFYTSVGEYLVIANTIHSLQFMLDDIDFENTWGKSLSMNKLTENVLQETNVSLLVNTNRFWEMILSNTNQKWLEFLKENTFQAKQFQYAAFQFVTVDDKFYSNMTVLHQPKERVVQTRKPHEPIQNLLTQAAISSKPFVVKSHRGPGFQVMIQDSTNTVYYITKEGDIDWQKEVGASIIGDITPIDYYKNGKIQYFFATENGFHVLDRNGDYIENFPINLPDTLHVAFANVIDYDNSHNYRFVVADKRTNIYLYDKEGKNLEGWTPRKVNGPLAMAPFHIRVQGRDCIVAMQANGMINLINRRGEMYPGFPLDLNGTVSSALFLEPKGTFETSQFTGITDHGELVQFNLGGAIIKRTQLYRSSADAKFGLVVDRLKRNYVIISQDLNRIKIFNRKQEEIFAKDFVTSQQMGFQYYDFGSSNELFAITDYDQEFTYLYDSEGQLINFQPFESSYPIALVYLESKGKYHVYRTYQNMFSILSLDK